MANTLYSKYDVMNDTNSLGTVLQRGEPEKHPLFNFNWVCEFLPFNHDVSYVESIDIPWSNISIGEGWFGAGSYTYFPSKNNISDVSITFYEDTGCTTQRWIYAWKNMVQNLYGSGQSYGAYRLPVMYKKIISFKLQATNGMDVLRVKLNGVWPAETSPIQLNYGNAEIIKVTQQFSVDGQSIEFLNQSGASALNFVTQTLETRFTNLPI